MPATTSPESVTLHGREYRLPSKPTIVVCVDGFDPEYLEAGCEDGILPNMASFMKNGFHRTAKSAMPSVTNPNNLSIITGAPTVAHGISTNYYLDRETRKEHMILDDSLMRGSTILELLADAGLRIAAITAKDKLRKIINHGLSPSKGAICFSAQYANQCTLAENGIENVEEWLGCPNPPQYSGELSIFVLDAGLKLLQEERADVFYLTLSDYIQHKFAPRSNEANEFLKTIDNRLGEFVKLGAVVAVTGDHGMSDKCNEHGEPNVLYLEDLLNQKWPGCEARVICPIADPFVRHHGALGGFVRAYVKDPSASTIAEMIQHCQQFPQVEAAYDGETAAKLLEMPLDREGDLVVIASANSVIGSRKDEHDLSNIKGHRLRSHGGFSEQAIPLLCSIASTSKVPEAKVWRNYDAFDIALNFQ